MRVLTRKPAAPLSAFIDYFWYFECSRPLNEKELTLPDGSIDIVIDLREERVRLADAKGRQFILNNTLMCGPHSEHFVIEHTKQSASMGIHFKPGGAFPFVGLPLDELHNTLLSMDMIWGSKAADLREELLEERSIEGKFHTLEKRLRTMANRSLPSHPAVKFALDKFADQTHFVDVSDVVERVGISHQRFIHIFKKETGFTPKRYMRIRRFQEVLLRLKKAKDVDWVDIAISCGYYDQAHFIKDFRAFSGLNPSSYMTTSGRHHNHALLP